MSFQRKKETSSSEQKRQALASFMEFEKFKPNIISRLLQHWQDKSQQQQFKRKDLTFFMRWKTLRCPPQLSINGPNLKVWLMGKVIINAKMEGRFARYHNSPQFKATAFAGISLDEQLQFEVLQANRRWKSERILIRDLWKYNQKVIIVPLFSTKPHPTLILEYSFSEQCPNSISSPEPLDFSFQSGGIVDQLVGCEWSEDPTTQYRLYKTAISNYESGRTEEVQFHLLKKYLELLEVNDLVLKSMTSEPFKSLNPEGRCQGTAFYRFYVALSQHIQYYDVQKMMWKTGNVSLRRFLNALKRFDQNPRINFTEKLYYLVIKIIRLVKQTSSVYWNYQFFEDGIIGRESAAYFVCLKLIYKVGVNYFKVGRRGLTNNSLLFHYMCKVYQPELYNQLHRLQINIESLFGMYSASLLAELFEGEVYYRMLEEMIIESNSYGHEYNFTIIAYFLALLERVKKLQSAFLTAQNFILAVKMLAKNMADPAQFLQAADGFLDKIKRQVTGPRFQELKSEMDGYYKANMLDTLQANMVVPEFFTIFSAYQHKKENQPRQMHICVNKIQINAQCPKLTLFVFQGKARIFQKQFINHPIRKLNFSFAIKLESLKPVIIAVYEDQKLFTRYCTLDPRCIPSNHMLQLVLPLQRSKSSIIDQPSSYICLQSVILEASGPVYYQNGIPQKYVHFFFDLNQIKSDVINLSRFVTSFKMVENNYNLLYGKLGWYNGYYVTPEERITKLYISKNASSVQSATPSISSRLFKIARFSRCAYGRAILSYPLPTSADEQDSYVIQHTKNGITNTSVFNKQEADALKSNFVSNSVLLCYSLDTVVTVNSSYLQFFYKCMDLPLFDYLTYNPIEHVVLPTLTFDVFLDSQKSCVIFSDQGSRFEIFDDNMILEIENGITLRRQNLGASYQFRFPEGRMYLDNFLHHLRLNILKQILNSQNSEDSRKVLEKWPNHLIAKSNQLSSPLPNMPIYKFFPLIIQTQYKMTLQFVEYGRIQLKNFRSLAHIKSHGNWRKVEILCHISAVKDGATNGYYFVEQEISRKTFIVAEKQVIVEGEVRIKLVCEQSELGDANSQLYKKLDRLL